MECNKQILSILCCTLTNSWLTLIFCRFTWGNWSLVLSTCYNVSKKLNNGQNDFGLISGRLKLLTTLEIQNFHLSFLTLNCLYSFMVIKISFLLLTFQILPRWNHQKGCWGHASCSQRGQLSGAAQRDPKKCLLLVTQVSTCNNTIREKWHTGEGGKLRVGFPCCPFKSSKTPLQQTQLYCIQAYSNFSFIPLI